MVIETPDSSGSLPSKPIASDLVKVSREDLWKVAQWFREYEASHAAKGSLDGDAKARRNAERAEFIEDMIEKAANALEAKLIAGMDTAQQRWARLAAPNARFSYGARKEAPGEKLLFGGNPEEHWGIQLWSINNGMATDQGGNWEFMNSIEWWSYSLPPLPENELEAKPTPIAAPDEAPPSGEIALLRAALKPFADFAPRPGSIADQIPDGFKITSGSSIARPQLTVGHCREARKVLEYGEKP